MRLPIHVRTEKPLPLLSLRLSPGLPPPGTSGYALGYNTISVERSEGLHTHSIFQRYNATRGVVEELQFPMRDSVVCPFPCFRTTARIDGGMSGSPFMRGEGNVIGVACSSYTNTGTEGHLSYISLIGPALLLQLVTGPDQRSFLHDSVIGKAVAADDTLSTLKATREGDMLEIDFGLPPPIRSILGD